MESILEKIVRHKKQEVANAKQQLSQTTLTNLVEELSKTDTGSSKDNFLSCIRAKNPAIIAEVKKASPSKGIICNEFDVCAIAQNYENGGAACLSVLTDEKFFQGKPEYVALAKKACSLPILRKDFIIDPYQIWQTKYLQADCILLIAAILDSSQILDFYRISKELGLNVLIEIHNLAELKKILNINFEPYTVEMIGINNRNLHTFEVSLQTSINLMKHIKLDTIVVSESGIYTYKDIQLLQNQGINSFLIGESLLSKEQPLFALKKLLGNL